jgi:hypothetical protein
MVEETIGGDPWVRLNKDLKEASRLLGAQEARWLVDTYYSIQKLRVASGNRVKGSDVIEPTSVLVWNHSNLKILEKDLKTSLGLFAESYTLGRWLLGICGIGPVLAANILSTFDIRNCTTAGQWWRFAGLDPSLKWSSSDKAKELVAQVMGTRKTVTHADIAICGEHLNRPAQSIIKAHNMLKSKKKKTDTEAPKPPPLTKRVDLEKALAVRPWNDRAKKTCFLISDQIVRQQERPAGRFYGYIYQSRKAYETENNKTGKLAEQAKASLKRVGKNTVTGKANAKGMLSDGHIDRRARRYAVKVFLSHVHAQAYHDYHGADAPMPYAFTDRCEGNHRHYIDRPDHVVEPGRTLRQLYGEKP